MSSPQDDPLAGLYVDEQESPRPEMEQEDDPLAGLYVDESGEKIQTPYRDVVSENLRAQGIEPDFSEELERATEAGMRHTAKGFLSGATIGLSEKIPGLETEPNASTTTGEFLGSIVPIEGAINVLGKPIVSLAKKSPYFKKTATALANLLGIGVAGGAYGATKEAVHKGEFPSTQDFLEHGFEWAALDALLRGAGLSGKFALSMFNAVKKTNKAPFKVVNDVLTQLKNDGVDIATNQRAGAKALSILEDMGQDVPKKGQTREISQIRFKKMNEDIDQLAEPILPEAPQENLNINSMVESAEQQQVTSRIDSVGRRSVDDSALGREIQEGINASREAARREYTPLYQEVEQGAQFIPANPAETGRLAGDLIEVLEEIRTRPKGYTTVIQTLEDILHDLGYTIQRTEDGVISEIIQEGNVPLNRITELGRRLNEIIDYDVLDTTIKDRLRPIARAAKRDTRRALEAFDEDLLAAFNLAEESYAINTRRFNRDSVRQMRRTEALEKLPKMVESATALNDLRPILSPQAMQNVERDLLEKMNRMTEGKAQDFLRKIRSGLSKESQEIADQIIRSKRPINKQSIQTRRSRLHEAIDNDLITAMNTGQRPKKTLDLWQNPRGQKLVRESLQTNPQRKELIEYLQKQTLQDMATSVFTKEGTLDFAKLKELMDNPALRSNLRELGGQEAVDFFESLSQKAKNFKKNADELVTEKLGVQKGSKLTPEEKKQLLNKQSTGEKGRQLLKRMATKDFPLATKIQNALDFLGFTGKVTLNLFTLIKFGLVKGAAIPIGVGVLKKLATSRKARNAFNEASKKHTNPLAFIAAVENLGNALDEEEKNFEQNDK